MRCPFCKKKINRYDGHHIYRCDRNNLNDDYNTKLVYISYNFPILSNKNNLYNEYIIKLNSLPDIRKEYGISYRNILFLLDHFEIKKRDLKKSSKLISSKKYKKTCLDKYGVDNISKLESIKRKKEYSHKKGVENNLSDNKEHYEWIKNELFFNKNIDMNLLKNDDVLESEFRKLIGVYYTHWNNLIDEEKNEIMNNHKPIESKVSSCLDKLNLTYTKNFKIGIKKFDLKLDNTYILIEVNDDFWHANPKKYSKSDVMEFPFKKVRAVTIWNKDRIKKKYAESKGYKLITIWENDIIDLDSDELIDFVINKIKFT